MDGTFIYCPKNFNQVYNIIGKYDNGKKFPLMYVIMSHKSYELYLCLFNYIKHILNIPDIIFTIDFEKAAQKALIYAFPKSKNNRMLFSFY